MRASASNVLLPGLHSAARGERERKKSIIVDEGEAVDPLALGWVDVVEPSPKALPSNSKQRNSTKAASPRKRERGSQFRGKRSTDKAKSSTDEEPHGSPYATADSEEPPPLMANRSVMVRSIYSKARQTLALEREKEEVQAAAQEEKEDNAEPTRRFSKVTLKSAALAIRDATHKSMMGRSLVSIIMGAAKESKEAKQRAESGGDDHEEEKEEEVKVFVRRNAVWLTSVIAELEQRQEQRQGPVASPVNRLQVDLSKLMSNLQDLQKRMEDDNEVSKDLTESIQKLYKQMRAKLGEVAVEVPELSGEIIKRLATKESKEFTEEEEVWHNAEADEEVPEVVQPQQPEPQPEEAAAPSVPKRRKSVRRKTTHSLTVIKQPTVNSLLDNAVNVVLSKTLPPAEELPMVSTRSASPVAETCAPPSGANSPIRQISSKSEKLSEKHESPCDSPKPPPESSLDLLPVLSPAPSPSFPSSVKAYSTEPPQVRRVPQWDFSMYEPLDPRDGDRQSYCAQLLHPGVYHSIGTKKVTLPPTLQHLLSTAELPELEKRLRCPFALVPHQKCSPRRLPPLKRRDHRKRHDPDRFTVEAVLAEREQRGLRSTEEDEGDEKRGGLGSDETAPAYFDA